jgi:hypothetical protein
MGTYDYGAQSTSPAQSSMPSSDDRYGILPVAGPSTGVAGMTVGAAPSVNSQVATPAGAYRPGGTSDFVPASTSEHVEIATRPSPTTTPAVPATPTGGNYIQSPYGTTPY